MRMNKKYITAVLGGAFLLASAASASAAVTKVRCVVWQGDAAKYHTAISTKSTRLKAVIDTDNTNQIWYRWVYGDGTNSGITGTALSGKKQYKISIDKTYTASAGTPFTAILQVDATSSAMTNVIEDTYLVKIETNDLNAQINIAIDNGLWYLFTNNLRRGGSGSYENYVQTYDDSDAMAWLQTSHVMALASPTASAVHAFGINSHKIDGNVNEDPYIEAVKLGMNYLVKGYNNSTGNPILNAVAIGTQTHLGVADNPEAGQTSANGYGVQVYDWGCQRPIYQGGQIMDAIISAGVQPSDLTGRDFTKTNKPMTVDHDWTYGELLQDMADMYAWGQSDDTWNNGTKTVTLGSWWYGWNSSSGDNSASQWAAIGLMPAQDIPWNVKVPQWVKDYNGNWLQRSMVNTNTTHGYFVYNLSNCAGDSCFQTTTSGLGQMAFVGQTGYDDPATPADERDDKWKRGQLYIADNWYSFLHNGSSWGGPMTYGWYSFAKAMRLARPNAITNIQKSYAAPNNTPFDWYYGDSAATTCTNNTDCRKGLARRIVDIQNAAGYWTGNLSNEPLTTAWMVITLKPALFAASPTACYEYNPKSTYSGDTVTFNPSCSGHSETGKTIANLTNFEWDWDNDGVYDESTSTPANATHMFTCATLPCTYTVTLRVSDDVVPPLTATVKQTVMITNPPHPPSAKIGGPYITSLCTGDTLILDGSGSTDPNEGTYQAGCTTCPNDTVTAWNWDLVAPLTDFVDKSGKTVTMTSPFVGDLTTAGVKSIGLRVADNTALAFPGSGQPNLTDDDFGSVTVYPAAACNIAARPKAISETSVKIQLYWTKVVGVRYDIYRSGVGPNTGFTRIAYNIIAPYGTFLDRSVKMNKDYWYRVMPNNGGASKAVKAKAVLR